MIKEIKMPNLGTTVDEMKIIKWFKSEGDRVERGEILFEVETDKASMEVESYLAGYLKKIVAGPGDIVETGRVVAYIGEENDNFENIQVEKPADKVDDLAKEPSERENEEDAKPRVSPMIRKLAEKHGVDVSKIKGSGPNGLILKEDVLRAASEMGTSAESKALEPEDKGEPEFVPYSRVDLAVAAAMTKSKSTIPHVYFSIDVDATAMQKLRVDSGKKYSYNAMIVYNVAKCLKKYPYLAARYDEKGRILAREVNIGLAVAKGNELFVPVIKGINEGSGELARVEQEMQRLIKKVETDQIRQDDISGGVFTVSNLGSYNISSFTAVINPPEVAILAVGAIQERVVAKDGGVFVRPMLTLTLSVDHRVANGAYAAGFLKLLKENLEKGIE